MIVMSAAWAVFYALGLRLPLGTATNRDQAELYQWINLLLVPFFLLIIMLLRVLLGVLVRRGRGRGPAIGFSVLWALALAWIVITAAGSPQLNAGGLLPILADLAASAYIAWALLTGHRPSVDPSPSST